MSNQHVEFEIAYDLQPVQDFGGDGAQLPDVPAGTGYVGDIVGFEKKTSSNNNTMIKVTFELVEGDYAGKRVSNNYTLTDSAAGRIKRLGMAIGAPLDRIRSSDYMGARVRFDVIHQEGKQQMNADGTPKLNNSGEPFPPKVFANVINERPLEEAQEAAPPPPPPVTRKASGNGAAVRRA